MESVTAGSGLLDALRTVQPPKFSGTTTRFSDVFADRQRLSSAGADNSSENVPSMMPGFTSHIPGEELPLDGRMMPFAMRPEGMPLPQQDTSDVQTDTDTGMVLDSGVDQQVVQQVLAPITPSVEARSPVPVVTPASPGEVAGPAKPIEIQGRVEHAIESDMTITESVDSPLPVRSLADAVVRPEPRMPSAPVNQVAVQADVNVDDVADAEPLNFRESSVLASSTADDAVTLSPVRSQSGADVTAMAAVAMRPSAVSSGPTRSQAPGASSVVAATTSRAPVEDASGATQLPPDFSAAGANDDMLPAGLPPIMPPRAASQTVMSGAGPDMPVSFTAALDTAVRAPVTTGEASALYAVDSAGEVAELSIDTPVDDPNWSEALNYRLQYMAQRGVQSARIQLNPVELGPMEVTVDVVDEVANVQIRADHGLTREALEQAAPRLRELMVSAGFDRAELDVSGGESDSRQRQGGLADGQSADQQPSPGSTSSDDNAGNRSGDSLAERSDGHRTNPDEPLQSGGLNLYA